ncbi:DUF2087 domain-containing protein [Streptomyces sp. NPDC048324]|uniref:DUF2087 domain-containing protein n=1 Tax=Streptomyces sp. NPDC048324 TaxID=3157205 RepID=UPI003429DB28
MSELSSAAEMLGALAASSRLTLLATVAERQSRGDDCSLGAVAAAVGRDPKSMVKDAVRLKEVGLLSIEGHTLAADLSALSVAADAIDANLPVTGLLTEDPDLERFFKHGRLVKLPENPDFRWRVAQLLVRLLPPDRQLSESEVNDLLGQVHSDYAALRRLLVDLKLVTRAASSDYQRVL